MVSFVRLVTFFREVRKEEPAARETLVHLKTVLADLGALSDHASFLASKIGFLLDATLGMINNEQNAIIKILSVAALVFLPPTLVAGVYGMNFDVMPELKWVYGYPFALATHGDRRGAAVSPSSGAKAGCKARLMLPLANRPGVVIICAAMRRWIGALFCAIAARFRPARRRHAAAVARRRGAGRNRAAAADPEPRA